MTAFFYFNFIYLKNQCRCEAKGNRITETSNIQRNQKHTMLDSYFTIYFRIHNTCWLIRILVYNPLHLLYRWRFYIAVITPFLYIEEMDCNLYLRKWITKEWQFSLYLSSQSWALKNRQKHKINKSMYIWLLSKF